MNPVELERRLQRIERQLDELASAGRPRVLSGSWTPEVYGATTYGTTTYSFRYGQYVLINRICIFWIGMRWTSTTASGQLRVSIPFACDSASTSTVIVPMRHESFSTPSDATLCGEIAAGNAYIYIVQVLSNGNDTLISVPSAGFLGFLGVYRIAA